MHTPRTVAALLATAASLTLSGLTAQQTPAPAKPAPKPAAAPESTPDSKPAASPQKAAGSQQDAQAKDRVLTPMDVMRLRQVTSAVLSASGETVAFTQAIPPTPKQGPARTRTRVLVANTAAGTAPESAVVLGTDSGARGIAFHPTTGSLTFIRKGEGDSHAEVYGMEPKPGAEHVKLTETPHGVGSYQWRPDGKALAFTIRDTAPKARQDARAAGFRQRVVDEDYDSVSLWVFREDRTVTRLTEGVSMFDFAWSPDGSQIAAAIAPRNLVDDRYMAKRLHIIDVESGSIRRLVENPGKLGQMVWSPDGKALAYISAADKRDPHAGMLYLVDTEAPAREGALATAKPLTDGFRGMVHHIHWERDGSIDASVSRGVTTAMVTIDTADGSMTEMAIAGSAGSAFRSFDRRGDTIALVASTPSHPSELLLKRSDNPAVRVTNSNPWLGEVALGRQDVMRITARDGLEIEGLLIHPVAKPTEPTPLVIIAHGGPESHFDNGWITSYSQAGQILAGRGYRVWYPNYRASTGYGVEFAKADHGDPMGGEFQDHLDAIAQFANDGLIDPARVGIIGGSYGGYTAAWAATAASEYFAAAVSFVPFVDIRTKWYTSDISNEFFLVHYQEKWPHEQVEFLAARSPLTFAANCKTPVLLLGGDADPRVHPSQPHMLYRAIRTATKTPTRYIQYPGEGHGNRVSTNRYDYLVRSLRWLEHYLREGDHRMDTPPPLDLDYSGWK